MTFPILCELLHPEVLTVPDTDMIEAMRLTAERMKMTTEAAAGAAIAAAIFKKHVDRIPTECKKIGVIVCGGNLDLGKIPWLK